LPPDIQNYRHSGLHAYQTWNKHKDIISKSIKRNTEHSKISLQSSKHYSVSTLFKVRTVVIKSLMRP